ncbi:hypothetical protein AJ80_02812, partial [Polytolypa hystricis UAMH7299]
FSLRSLIQDRPHNIDTDEFALATSPCLHSIAAIEPLYDSGGKINYNEEALLQMVAASAPGLKFVCLSSDVRHWRAATPRTPWPGFFVNLQPGQIEPPRPARSRGSLESLIFDNSRYDSTQTGEITTWSKHTDFSKLRCLEFDRIPVDTLRTLTQLAEDGQLKSLHTLIFLLEPYPCETMPLLDEYTGSLLQALPPLRNLGLRACVADKVFTALLTHHGPALHTLDFKQSYEFALTHTHISLLQQHCPNLRAVTLRVRRSQGDKNETRIYRTLGKLAHLHSADLSFDIGVGNVNLENPSDLDIHDILINAAIDESLARSIFDVIATANARICGHRNPPFHFLKLKISDASVRDTSWDVKFTIADMIWFVEREWTCRRRSSDGQVVVKETGKFDRAKPYEGYEGYKNISRFKEVWRRAMA